jgi:hypothetical protein
MNCGGKRTLLLIVGLLYSSFVAGQTCRVLVSVFEQGSHDFVENVHVSITCGDSILASDATNHLGKVAFSLILDSSKTYSVNLKREGYHPTPPSIFKPEINNGAFNSYFFDLIVYRNTHDNTPFLPVFEGGGTKIPESFNAAVLLHLLSEYPGLCLEIIFAKPIGEKRKTQRRRTRSLIKLLKENKVDFNRLVFSKTTIEGGTYCESCFQGTVVSMDGC